jgi:hypothetical protein
VRNEIPNTEGKPFVYNLPVKVRYGDDVKKGNLGIQLTTERGGELSRAPFTGYIGASCLGRRVIEEVRLCRAGERPSPHWRDGDV